jgi:hypothetical protein
MHTAHAARDLSAPRDKVFEFLADNERFGVLFAPARFEHVSDGRDSRGGVGSVRKVSFWGLLPFYETVQVSEPSTGRIEYAVTKGTPLRDHHGTVLLTDLPGGASGCHVDYTITFDGPPVIGAVVASGLRARLPNGLDRLEESTKP